MSWVKIDDQFFMHPKVIAAGRDARDLYLAALTYTAGQLTDGFVPAGALPLIAAMAGVPDAADLAARLVDVRLWEPTVDGYNIHDYHEYNPSAKQVRAVREARAEAGRRGGLAAAASKAEANDQANDEQNPTPSPSPSPSPDPIPVPEEERVTPAPAPAPKQRAKRPSRADPRTKHPAIQCVKGILGGATNPPLVLYDQIIGVLGERPDGSKLAFCYQEWVKRGFKPGNYAWLFDWYVKGVPADAGSARGSPTRQPSNTGKAEYTDPATYLRAMEGNRHGE